MLLGASIEQCSHSLDQASPVPGDLSAVHTTGWVHGHLLSTVSWEPVGKSSFWNKGSCWWSGFVSHMRRLQWNRTEVAHVLQPALCGFQGGHRSSPCSLPARSSVPLRACCCLFRLGSTNVALFFRVSAVAESCLRFPVQGSLLLAACKQSGRVPQTGKEAGDLEPYLLKNLPWKGCSVFRQLCCSCWWCPFKYS